TMTLYVNGTANTTNLPGSTFYTDWNGGWNAPGPVDVGAGLIGGARGVPFAGAISDVRIWARVVTADELLGTDDDGNGNGQIGLLDPRAVSAQVGWWDFADQSPDCGCAYDTQTQDHFSRARTPDGGVSATADDHDGNTAWTFDGSTGYGRTAGPVLRTDQSFTVSAWVRLASTCVGSADVILAQDGTTVSPFTLEYNCSVQKWRFWMASADSTTYTAYAAASPVTALDIDWHLVLGVYDAGAGQLRLYVDGALAGSASAPAAPFNGTGPVTIGRQLASGAGTGFFAGDIDEVTVRQGALPDYAIADLYSTS
ncbi:MAG TPA: LamG-like jellyroll fold domain-containing protein, partial [Jatrophihabitans sp.]|nr:LamG-like jellyroll fold domain-containing protein [Jatrophihabitans sp.]